MFLLELVAPWLLLVPITVVRRVGVLVQLPLQLGVQRCVPVICEVVHSHYHC